MIHTDLIRPISELLRRQAQVRGNATSYEDERRAVTYADLDRRTACLAGHMQAMGLATGRSVAVLLPNSVDWIETAFAVARAGGVVVPISFDATEDEVAYRLADANCAIVVTMQARTGQVARLTGARQILIGSDFETMTETSSELPRDPDELDAPRFIVYTSGTTGKAKGVVLTERSLLWVTAACWSPITGIGPDDRILSPLPLFHSYALSLSVLTVLATGASEFILERFSTSRVQAQLATGRFTVLPGVPTMFHYLLDARRGTPPPEGLRVCISAGAIMPGTLNESFEAALGVPLLDGYGITETSTMVTMNWPPGARGGSRVMGSCGIPVPGLAVRIVDAADRRDVRQGQEGELIVRGPNVMLGYHNKPAETQAVLRDGWYRTGDLARADANGFLTITGRLKELIIRGGQNVAPAEVEEVVSLHPAVLDCAVVGIAHEYLGEVPVVFVVPRDDRALDTAALLAHCADHLSAYKIPAAVHEVAAIPRTGSGKVMRFRLREML